jgi:hypothetical protein
MNVVHEILVSQIEDALLSAARLVERDARALPIFERLDAELRKTEALIGLRSIDDPISKAREMARIRKQSAGK